MNKHRSLRMELLKGVIPNPYEIREQDLNVWIDHDFGRVIKADIGKRIYLRDGLILMENYEQATKHKKAH